MIEFFRPRRRRNKFRLDGSETFVDYIPTKLEYTDVLLLLVDFADKNVDSLHIGFIRRLRIVCRLDPIKGICVRKIRFDFKFRFNFFGSNIWNALIG